MAWSGCTQKTKLINKQIIHSQDLCLLVCLNKWSVLLTYVKDQGAVLAKLVLFFLAWPVSKKNKFSHWLLYFQSVPKLLEVLNITDRKWWKVVSEPWNTQKEPTHTPILKSTGPQLLLSIYYSLTALHWFGCSIQLVLINENNPFVRLTVNLPMRDPLVWQSVWTMCISSWSGHSSHSLVEATVFKNYIITG